MSINNLSEMMGNKMVKQNKKLCEIVFIIKLKTINKQKIKLVTGNVNSVNRNSKLAIFLKFLWF